jgi:hypothetical protein
MGMVDAQEIEGSKVVKAPFPWFGGKSKIATEICNRFAGITNYVEPFCGSATVWLSCQTRPNICTLNDIDGLLINFYRAVQHDPDAVASYADWPVSEADLFPRHVWLVKQRVDLAERLQADPDYYDVKAAGWWVWGACAWIGTGWTSGEGPWSIENGAIVNIRGNAGWGVNRQLPHLGSAGQGVNRKPSKGESVREHLYAYMNEIADVLRVCRITCGSWERVVTPIVTYRHGLTGVFLDPPYGDGNMDYSAGGNADKLLMRDVREWAISEADNPLMRIAICGYDDLQMPEGWVIHRWKANKGYQTKSNDQSHREVVWFSPHCLKDSNSDSTLRLF